MVITTLRWFCAIIWVKFPIILNHRCYCDNIGIFKTWLDHGGYATESERKLPAIQEWSNCSGSEPHISCSLVFALASCLNYRCVLKQHKGLHQKPAPFYGYSQSLKAKTNKFLCVIVTQSTVFSYSSPNTTTFRLLRVSFGFTVSIL